MTKTYIGIDNGVSGSLAIIRPDGFIDWKRTPTFSQLNYTKEKKNVTRVDFLALQQLLLAWLPIRDNQILVTMERPMVNPTRFAASLSAIRALEATLICLEQLGLPYQYIDSRVWQHALLPKCKDTEDLKLVSFQVGKRMFPTIAFKNDADSLLMAEYARIKQL